MKILVVHNRYIEKGGEESCVDNEVVALRQAGHEIELFAVQNQLGLVSKLQALMAPLGKGLEKSLESKIATCRPQIVHAHNLFPLLSPRVFRAARKHGAKTVLTLHNYRPLCLNGLFMTPRMEICERCAGGNYLPGILRGCYRRSYSQSGGLATHLWAAKKLGWYRFVDLFIAPNIFLRNKYVQKGYPESKFAVQGHFLPKMPLTEPVPPGPYVLFMGRLSEEKGLRWLLQTFQNPQLPLQLMIAGRGPLQSEVEKACGATITYLGFLNGSEKDRVVQSATAVIMSSECYENFPMAIAEANSWGVPTVVGDLGAFTDMVVPGENGERYTLKDSESFWTNLRKIHESMNPMTLRNRCQVYARHRFSKSDFVTRRLELYNGLLC